MINKLVDDIHNYIIYLENTGLYITLHGKAVAGLLDHNIHTHPYCTLVKTDESAWQKCVSMQQKVYEKHDRECYFGMCYAGVEEYIFFVDEKTFVSVSGYGIHRERAVQKIDSLSKEFMLDREELLGNYDRTLKHEKGDEETLKVLIRPLCHMISLLSLFRTQETGELGKNQLFDTIYMYVQRNYMREITVEDVARACACSVSTVCHLFKEYKGQSIKKYITQLRISQACKLLSSGNLSISAIAGLCGYSNVDYFSTAFKKEKGMTPTQYRRR